MAMKDNSYIKKLFNRQKKIKEIEEERNEDIDIEEIRMISNKANKINVEKNKEKVISEIRAWANTGETYCLYLYYEIYPCVIEYLQSKGFVVEDESDTIFSYKISWEE